MKKGPSSQRVPGWNALAVGNPKTCVWMRPLLTRGRLPRGLGGGGGEAGKAFLPGGAGGGEAVSVQKPIEVTLCAEMKIEPKIEYTGPL